MTSLSILREEASTCTRCALAETRTQVVFGVGDERADLLFIGEGPGREEDLKGEPFVGRSGKLLDRLVTEELGISRDQYYIANVVKCRPPNNRDPKPEEISACSVWLKGQLDIIDPKVIVTLGNFATRTILKTTEGITKLRGRIHRWEGSPRGGTRPGETGGDRLVVPTFHPSAALRTGAETVAKMRSDLVRAKRVIAGDLSEVN